MERSLGEATTAAERDLEAAISRVSPWQGHRLRYRSVSGGINNANWRVWVDDDPATFFVKIPGKGTEMFVDRAVAMHASRQAADLGIGPRVYDFLAADGIEISDFVETRRSCTHADFRNLTLSRTAIDCYRTLHGGAMLSQTKTVFDRIDETHEQVRMLGGWQPPDFLKLDHQYRRARAALEASGLDLVPCFNDPMAGNFMTDDAGTIMMIDYEFASNNDRCYDLGVWFAEMFFDEPTERALIAHYFGRADPAIVARVTVHQALADLTWAAWSMVQLKMSVLDFDFFKYGVWRYRRARAVLDDPRWDGWLKAV
ncbi:choline/ethanolamine kinase family protein [Acidisoma cladoniae]|uniref:choline/ethanolamine kinase family protein n=1 Tax=Acidisoma cladoniae TaxID=3040935 RepID=UPI00254FC01E|nr:choline/ethanolamine kinase family protein [Acidisoma sp. PAMC 29798]